MVGVRTLIDVEDGSVEYSDGVEDEISEIDGTDDVGVRTLMNVEDGSVEYPDGVEDETSEIAGTDDVSAMLDVVPSGAGAGVVEETVGA